MTVPLGPDVSELVGVSNGTVVLNSLDVQHSRRYHDYQCELEKMAIRFCKSAGLISATPEGTAIMEAIPDSLFNDYTMDGFFTIQMPASGYSSYIDLSLLGRSYHYIQETQDTVIDYDFTMAIGAEVNYIFNATFGIVDKEDQHGVPSLSGTTLDAQNLQASFSAFRSAFDALELTAPAAGYKQGISLNEELKPGRLFIVKTSENAYAAIVCAGVYIGGIDRYHFYFSYTTDGVFRKNGGLTPTLIQQRPCRKNITGNKNLHGAIPQKKGSFTLQGQKAPDASSVPGCSIQRGRRAFSMPDRSGRQQSHTVK
jgi:hypothetical protein